MYPLPYPYVCHSVHVCDVEHICFHFGIFASFVCACLVSVHVLAPHSWQHAGVIEMSLQTDDKDAFEEMRVILRCIFLFWLFSLSM